MSGPLALTLDGEDGKENLPQVDRVVLASPCVEYAIVWNVNAHVSAFPLARGADQESELDVRGIEGKRGKVTDANRDKWNACLRQVVLKFLLLPWYLNILPLCVCVRESQVGGCEKLEAGAVLQKRDKLLLVRQAFGAHERPCAECHYTVEASQTLRNSQQNIHPFQSLRDRRVIIPGESRYLCILRQPCNARCFSGHDADRVRGWL